MNFCASNEQIQAEMDQRKQRKDPIGYELEKMGLTMGATFIPFTQSRNATDKGLDVSVNDLSLNWRVSLYYGGKMVLTTDYSQGVGHCVTKLPWNGRVLAETADRIRYECETGKPTPFAKMIKAPDIKDVLYCLVADSSAYEYASFEEWAGDMGYDTDSRKAETIYNECNAIAVRIVKGLGHDVINKLQELFQDY